jgi:hypothetical protein
VVAFDDRQERRITIQREKEEVRQSVWGEKRQRTDGV